MGFRGIFGPEATIGAEVAYGNVFANGVATNSDFIDIPGGRTRWRVYAVWASITGFMQANGAGHSVIRGNLSLVDEDTGAAFGAWSTRRAAPQDEWAQINLSGPMFAIARGMLLSPGARVQMRLTVNLISGSAAQVVETDAHAIIFGRGED